MSNTNYKIYNKAIELANAFGYLFPAECCLLQATARNLKDNAVAVTIGAGVGTSSLALAEIRPDLDLYTVDISEGGPNGGLENEINAFRNAGMSELLPTHILGNSQLVHKSWKKITDGLEIDILFIDGDHSETALQGDLDGWLPLVTDGGYVLIHDYDSVNWSGVTDVVNKNMTLKNGWQFVLQADTTVCYRKVTVAEPIPQIGSGKKAK